MSITGSSREAEQLKRPAVQVTIGVPVYNGEAFLPQLLDCLLAQSFRDFQLIISDNASTDRTPVICREYAASDTRVRYRRNDTNVGGAQNHNLLVAYACSKYFLWVAADDLLAPTYIEKCMDMLERDPSAVLCYAASADIGPDGRVLGSDNEYRRKALQSSRLGLDSDDVRVRYRDVIKLEHLCEGIYGLVRTNVLKQTGLNGLYPDSDRVLLAELALRGRIVQLPDCLFFHREHESRSVAVYPTRQQRMVWMDPSRAGKIVFPYWLELREFVRAVRRAPLNGRDRWACLLQTLRWAARYSRLLWTDLTVAARMLLKRFLPARTSPDTTSGELKSHSRIHT